MRVLVTGGGGFLGAAAVRALLARGDTAIAFDTRLGALAATGPDERLIARAWRHHRHGQRRAGGVGPQTRRRCALRGHRRRALVARQPDQRRARQHRGLAQRLRGDAARRHPPLHPHQLGGSLRRFPRRQDRRDASAGSGAAVRDLQGGGRAARPQLPCAARARDHQPAHLLGLWPGAAARSHPQEPGRRRAGWTQAAHPDGRGLGDRPHACRRRGVGHSGGARSRAASLRRLQRRQRCGGDGRRDRRHRSRAGAGRAALGRSRNLSARRSRGGRAQRRARREPRRGGAGLEAALRYPHRAGRVRERGARGAGGRQKC